MAAQGTALVPTLLVTREHAAHGSHISEPVRAAHDRSFVNCLNAGVRIVLGTDVGGFEWTRVSQAEEFTLMTRLGMSAADALRAGTLWAAELLGLAGTTGVIEPGAAADIVSRVFGEPRSIASAFPASSSSSTRSISSRSWATTSSKKPRKSAPPRKPRPTR